MSVQRQQRALSLGQAAARLPRHVAPTDTKTPSVGYTGKPAAQIAAEHSEWRDNQPIATSCGFCGWRFDGTAAEGRVEARTHRESEHPEATVRRARGRRRVTLRRDQQDAGTRSQIKLEAAEANRVRAEREEAERLVKVLRGRQREELA